MMRALNGADFCESMHCSICRKQGETNRASGPICIGPSSDICGSGSGLWRPALCSFHLSVGDALPARGSRPPKQPSFGKNQDYCFRKIDDCTPFSWIRHKSSTEITAFSTFYRGDHLPDGLGYVEMKRRLVLAIPVFGIRLRVTAGG